MSDDGDPMIINDELRLLGNGGTTRTTSRCSVAVLMGVLALVAPPVPMKQMAPVKPPRHQPLAASEPECVDPRCGTTSKRSSESSKNPDDTVRHWEYDPDVARTEMCRLIARTDLPLSFGASVAFQDYIRTAHNPRFTAVSRQTTTRDFVKLFNTCRAKLMNRKRLLALRLIDESHTGQNIDERVLLVLDEHGLKDKVFSVTLDNASSNTTTIDKLTPSINGYIGNMFMHQRCACHIINLIVKSGLKRLKPYLEAFRTAISFLNSSNLRIAGFKSYCIAVGELISVFIDIHYSRAPNENLLLTDLHWYVAEKILEFLEVFYDATVVISGVYYATSPLMIHQLLSIARHLHAYENDDLLRHSVVPMKTKFLKYWRNIPALYAFAFILDPRGKMKGFYNVLRVLSSLTGTDYSAYSTQIRAELNTMFEKYNDKFGSVRLQRPPVAPSGPGKRRTNWGMVFGENSSGVGSATLGVGLVSPSPSVSTRGSATALLQAASAGSHIGATELSSYLDSDTVNQYNDDDFDILN
ncbi:zinc finger BED domain-containing protein RICESLEEPER 1-like [Oryza brachyantha]|uniref:zinc finger BED domain-containing protein RICESLEEPER 1-like n=1 Tax=Oryza brachyantha TaxID=4533 RepID=UPI001ADC2600|nr:zinc finger BED domain-containing protein RICESLEEPER 1-like [Oryza brachyantha]